MNKDIFLVGASGHGKVVLDIAILAGFNVVAILDDDPARKDTILRDIPVIGGAEMIPALKAKGVVSGAVAIGSNIIRKRVADKLTQLGCSFEILIHPSAVIDRTARLGPGTVVMAGAIVNAEAVLGEHVIVNSGASVDHDCRISSYVHLGPGVRLCGNVGVGENSLLGVGAVVIPGIRIGASATVGAGAAVIADVQDNVTVIGVPATPQNLKKD